MGSLAAATWSESAGIVRFNCSVCFWLFLNSLKCCAGEMNSQDSASRGFSRLRPVSVEATLVDTPDSGTRRQTRQRSLVSSLLLESRYLGRADDFSPRISSFGRVPRPDAFSFSDARSTRRQLARLSGLTKSALKPLLSFYGEPRAIRIFNFDCGTSDSSVPAAVG
jgi:hypothetical protein